MSSRRLLTFLIISEAVLRTPELSKCCVRKLGPNSVYSCSIRRFAGYHGENLSMRVRTGRRNRFVSGIIPHEDDGPCNHSKAGLPRRLFW